MSADKYLGISRDEWRLMFIYASQESQGLLMRMMLMTMIFFPLAINDSCLVFDGRLVIDADFHTNDPCIRAAGPLTKFQRRYHAESWQVFNYHDNYH